MIFKLPGGQFGGAIEQSSICNPIKNLDQKIQKLYGPLYGNRLMYQSGIDAVSERQKMTIKQYIRKVCQEKDEIGLESEFIFL